MSTDNEAPVKVVLTVADWLHVPTRTYSKTIEFDREDWGDMDRRGREREIEEALREYCLETFSRDYEIEGGSLDDPTT